MPSSTLHRRDVIVGTCKLKLPVSRSAWLFEKKLWRLNCLPPRTGSPFKCRLLKHVFREKIIPLRICSTAPQPRSLQHPVTGGVGGATSHRELWENSGGARSRRMVADLSLPLLAKKMETIRDHPSSIIHCQANRMGFDIF